MEMILDDELPRSRLAVLLKQFSQIEDGRQSWRVAFPLAEMLLLLTCATIADCDDFDEIIAWGSSGFSTTVRAISFWDPVCPLVADVGQPSRSAAVRELFRELD
jgi:hypothetical protein